MNQEKAIAVVGIGGVGGYLAGMLTRRYKDVTLVARGEKYEAIRDRGLVLHSEINGDSITRPGGLVRDAGEINKPLDYLFLCVKNYSLKDLLPHLSGAIGENTVILPVMNGVDPGDVVREGVKGGIVVKSLIYIVAFARQDYSISQQGDQAKIIYGIGKDDQDKLTERGKRALTGLGEVLSGAGIECEEAGDIELAIWKKYVLNCAYNVSTAYYDCPISGIRSWQERKTEYALLTREAYEVGRAKGIPLTEADVKEIVDRLDVYQDGASSSLQRDMHEGREAEIETFSGYLVREGKRLGIPVPVSERMYEGLKGRARSQE